MLVRAAARRTTNPFAGSRTHSVAIHFPDSEGPGSGRFVEAIAQRGHVQGRDITYEVRASADRPELLAGFARELVARRPAVIANATEPAARAAAHATRDMPIVLAPIPDPIALGLTQNAARPTRNLTRFADPHHPVPASTPRSTAARPAAPTLCDVRLIGVSPSALSRSRFERNDGAQYAQSWLVHDAQ